MSALRKTKLTALEYLAIERAAAFKSEFFDGEMFPMHQAVPPQNMAGASPPHNIIRENLSIEIGSRLKGSECRTVSSDQRLLVERTGLYTYPDLMVICGEWEFAADDANAVTNPVTIVEVLSPSTERYDRGAKFRNYQQLPSLFEYVLVSQDEAVCERFVRQEDGSWALTFFVGLSDTLEFTTVPVRVPLADIYAGVALPAQPPR
jgi:Uma2 family endonuclease